MRFVNVTLTREGEIKQSEGFPIEWEPFPHVRVGAPNRDRKFIRVPIGKKYAEELKGKELVLAGSFMKTREKGTLLLIEEQSDPRSRIGVLFYAQPGYRGTSQIHGEPDTKLASDCQIWDSPCGSFGIGDVLFGIVKPYDRFEVNRTGRLYGALEDIVVVIDEELHIHAMSMEEEANEKEAVKEEVKGEVL